MDKETEELKPCPFCGLPPVVHEFEDGWTVECYPQNKCPVEPVLQEHYHRKENAIKAWNKRA